MTDKAQILALAEKVEALSGPDREVDGLIAIYIAPNTPWIVGNEPGRFPQKPINGTFRDCLDAIEDGKDRADYIAAPRYTSSLDAAMTLVPDCHRTGVLYHALKRIQETGFPNSTFLHRLICEIVASALRAIAEGEEG